MEKAEALRGKGAGYPVVHERPAIVRSFDRLEKLWARYPQYHEMTTFSTMEALAAEHESWQADFEEVRGEYMENQYDRFLVQLSWSDLPYRYAAKEKIQAAGPLPANPYVEAFMEQFAGLDTDHKACFLFPESFLSQFFVIMEICRNAESVRPVRNLFPDEEKPHYLAVAFFGGEEALEQRRELDLQKKELCEQNDVRLIEWAYDVEPTVGNIKRMLARAE